MRTIAPLCLAALVLAGCATTPETPTADGPPWFFDTAVARGIDHVTTPEVFGNDMMTMGGGIAVADVDLDGDQDLYFVEDGPNLLYINQGDGTFVDGTGTWDVGDSGMGRAPLFFDADNDGDPDLFVGNLQGPSRYYRNEGTRFVSAPEAGMDVISAVHAVAAADIDNDGDLDVAVGNYGAWWDTGQSEYGEMPAERNFLYINQGDGTFVEEGSARGFDIASPTLGAGFGDIDNDGDMDLGFANDFGHEDEVWFNDGEGNFHRATPDQIESRRDGMGIIWADFDNDGWLDLYVSNIFHPHVTPDHDQGNFMWHNQHDGSFVDVARESNTQDALWSWGGVAFDADCDRDLDLFVPNGFPSAPPDPLNHTDRGMQMHQPNRFFENLGQMNFISLGEAWGLDHRVDGRGAIGMDLDGDRDIDLVTTGIGDTPLVLENRSGHGDCVLLELEGTVSNRDAVGARAVLSTPEGDQIREVALGMGYVSQGPKALHFGLGSHGSASVTVTWPSGIVDTFTVQQNKSYDVVEGQGAKAR